MTVVAVLFVDSLPIIVADSLISTSGNVPGVPDTPLTEKENRAGLDGFLPSGIARKIWTICDGAVFLYSGRIDHAQQVFERIGRDMQIGRRYDGDVHQAVVDVVRRDNLEVSFIVLTMEPDGEIGHYYHGNVGTAQTRRYGRVIAIGSGARELVDFLQNHPSAALPDPHTSLDGYMEKAVLNAVNASATLTVDYRDPESRMAAVSTGGYFEVIFPVALCPEDARPKLNKFFGHGVAHLFLEIEDERAWLVKLVISHQDPNKNFVLTTREGVRVGVGGDALEVPTSQLLSMDIRDLRHETSITPFDGKLPGTTVSHLLIYGVRKCATCSAHIRTRNTHVGLNGSIADIEAAPDALRITLTAEGLIDRMIVRLAPYSRCDICQRSESDKTQHFTHNLGRAANQNTDAGSSS